MTQQPEAALARELGICYAAVAVVTDYDSGLDDRPDEAPVTQDQVFALFAKHLPDLRDLLVRTIAKVPASRSCACMAATNGIPPVTPVSSL
jgi:5'-methylthioadenosine phosphorylase